MLESCGCEYACEKKKKPSTAGGASRALGRETPRSFRPLRWHLVFAPATPHARPAMAANPHAVKDYTRYFSERAMRRKPSPIRALQAMLAADPTILSLGGGMPNPQLFPFKGLSLDLDDGTSLKLSQADLDAALQYSSTPCVRGARRARGPRVPRERSARTTPRFRQPHPRARVDSAFSLCVCTGVWGSCLSG